MKYHDIIESCYGGDAAAKLELARKLATQFAGLLMLDPEVCKQLDLLKAELAVLDTHMSVMAMGKSCTLCAAQPDGGCCSTYMGNENNDALLLLINILAGVDVQLVCGNGVECCFLGNRGCVLSYKPIFCLNYLCGHIRDVSTREMLNALEQKSGALLSAQYHLEQMVIHLLQQAAGEIEDGN